MKVSDILNKDYILSVRLIEHVTGISKNTINRNLKEDLKNGKVYAKLVHAKLVPSSSPHHDDQKVQAFLASNGFVMSNHTPYSPDLSPMTTPQIYSL